MALVDINWNPSRKELRVFSLLLIGFGVIVASWSYQRFDSATPAIVTMLATGLVGIAGLAAPRWVRLVYVVWMVVVFPIGWTVSHAMMLAVFFLVLTPIGLVMRLCGRDPMQRKFDQSASTYWQPRTDRDDVKSYFRQY